MVRFFCILFLYLLQNLWNFFEIRKERVAHTTVIERRCGMIERQKILCFDACKFFVK